MYLKYKVIAFSFEELPKDVLQEIFKFLPLILPLKDLVSARAVSSYFKNNIDSLQAQESFKVSDLCSFMTFKIKKARIRIEDIQEILDMSRTINQNQASLSTIHNNFQYLESVFNERAIEKKDIRKWIKEDSECKVTCGLSGISTYVDLNTEKPSIYGVIKMENATYVGAILTRDALYDPIVKPGAIDLRISKGANGIFEKHYGCEIDDNGELVAGKIGKKVVRYTNGDVLEWVGCEIDDNGELVAGKIGKKVVRYTDGEFLEWVGCAIDTNGELVAGKIEKKVYREGYDEVVVECVGCEINADGNLVAGKIDKKVVRDPNGDVFEWFGC